MQAVMQHGQCGRHRQRELTEQEPDPNKRTNKSSVEAGSKRKAAVRKQERRDKEGKRSGSRKGETRKEREANTAEEKDRVARSRPWHQDMTAMFFLPPILTSM